MAMPPPSGGDPLENIPTASEREVNERLEAIAEDLRSAVLRDPIRMAYGLILRSEWDVA